MLSQEKKIIQNPEGFTFSSDDLQQSPSQNGSTYESNHVEDAVFGGISEDGPNYRNVCPYPDKPSIQIDPKDFKIDLLN